MYKFKTHLEFYFTGHFSKGFLIVVLLIFLKLHSSFVVEKVLVKNYFQFFMIFLKKNIWNLTFTLKQTVFAVPCVCVKTNYTFWSARKIMHHKKISLPVSDCMFSPQHHEYLMSDSHESIRWCAKYTLKNINSIRLKLSMINNCSCHYEKSNVS